MDLLDLYAKLSLDTEDYDSGMSDAEDKANSFGSKVGSGLKTAGSIAGKAMLGVGSAAVAVSGALVATASSTAKYGDQVDKDSQKMGISAKAYQEWDAVLQHSGSSMSSMKTSFKTLSNAAQDASKDQVAAFEAIGLSMEDVASMSTEELWDTTIAGLQGMESGTRRTAIASDLLGKGATELGALLNTSAEDTQAMKDRVNELGGVMSDEGVSAAATFQDNLQDIQTGMAGIGYSVGGMVIPYLNSFMETVITNMPTIQSTITSALSGAATVLSTVGSVAMSIFNSIKSGIETVMSSVSGGGITWSTVWNGISNAVSIAGAFVSSTINMIATVLGALVSSATTQGTVLNTVWNIISTTISTVGGVISGVVTSITALFNGDLSGAVTGIGEVFGTVFEGLTGVVSGFFDFFGSIINTVGGWISGIKNFFTGGGGEGEATAAEAVYTATAESIATSTDTAASNVETNMATISSTMSTEATTQQESVTTAYETMTKEVETAMEDQGTAVTDGTTAMETTLTTSLDNINTNAETGLTTLQTKWSNAMTAISTSVSTAMATVSSLLNQSYSVNIAVSNSATGSTEHFAKAMGHAYLLNGATTFGTMGDKRLVGGEAGQEMVVGTGTLMSAISAASGNAEVAQVVAAVGDQIIGVLGQYLPWLANNKIVLDTGVLVGEIAGQMDDTLGNRAVMARRGAFA